jgi:hypothetical protein
MPLICLDTPQFHLLEGIRGTDAARYVSFIETWRSRGCTLVFTMAQASELGRYENEARRKARYPVLSDLAPIRTDLPVRDSMSGGPRTFVEREILRAMIERDIIRAANPDVDSLAKWAEILPGPLSASEGVALAVIEMESYKDLLKREYEASRFEAAAEKSHGQAEKRGRVRDLPNSPLTVEELAAGRAGMQKALASVQDMSERGELPRLPADAIPQIARYAEEFYGRAAEVGCREALLERLPVCGLASDKVLKLEMDELVEYYLFQSCVRSFARDVLNVDTSCQEFLVRTLGPRDCPGFWLHMRLDLCIRRRVREPKPSHHFDAERLAYLPYVDLMLTDKEMAEFVREIRDDESSPPKIRNTRPAVRISGSIDALEEAVCSL